MTIATKMKKPTATEMEQFLNEHDVHPNVVSVTKGVYKIKRSYFDRGPRILASMLERIKKIDGIEVIDSGDHWHSFVGGAKAGSAQDSYVWITFTVKDKVWTKPESATNS